METLHFQWQESQQEEAIPFRRKAHLLKEGQIHTWPPARKNISGNDDFISQSDPIQGALTLPSDLAGLNRN